MYKGTVDKLIEELAAEFEAKSEVQSSEFIIKTLDDSLNEFITYADANGIKGDSFGQIKNVLEKMADIELHNKAAAKFLYNKEFNESQMTSEKAIKLKQDWEQLRNRTRDYIVNLMDELKRLHCKKILRFIKENEGTAQCEIIKIFFYE